MSDLSQASSHSRGSPKSALSPIKGMKIKFGGKTFPEEREEPAGTGDDSNVPKVQVYKRRKIEKGQEEEFKLTHTLDIDKWAFDPKRKRDLKGSTRESINRVLGLPSTPALRKDDKVKCTISSLKDFKLELKPDPNAKPKPEEEDEESHKSQQTGREKSVSPEPPAKEKSVSPEPAAPLAISHSKKKPTALIK